MTDTRNDLPPVNSPNFLEKVREALSTYLGNRGSKLDRGLTVRDLSDAGLVDLNQRWLQSGGKIPPISGPGSAIGGADVYEPDLTPPPTPSGFAATAAISNLLVECDPQTYPQGHGHAKSRLYGATWTSGPLPVFADAVVITEFSGTVASHATNPSTTWHLWLTWVTVDGVESTTPAGGTNGVVTRTGEDVALLLDALTGEITESQLYADLGARINLIDAPTTGLQAQLAGVNSSINAINATLADIASTQAYAAGTTYTVDTIVAYNGALYQAKGATTGNLPTNTTYWTKVGDYASIGDAVAGHAVILSDHATRITSTEGGLISVAGRASVLETAVNNTTTGLGSKASVAQVATAKSEAIAASASVTDTISARLNSGDFAAVQEQSSASASSVTGLLAQYTVKLDVGGKVSGYGLASSSASSEFAIRADRFYIAPPAGSAVTTSIIPFAVQATATTINGVAVPAGVYMNDAYIKNGTITTAKIGNAAIDDAKIANLSAAKLTIGDGTVGGDLKSSTFSTTPGSESGWKIQPNGTATFNNAIVRGAIYATSGYLRGLDIQDAAGNVILSSGNTLAQQVTGWANMVRSIAVGSYSDGAWMYSGMAESVDRLGIIVPGNTGTTCVFSSAPMNLTTNGGTYCVSFLAHSDIARNLNLDLFPDTLPQSSVTITPGFKQYSFVWTSSHADMANCALRFIAGSAPGQMYICNVKIEPGGKATPWRPHILDAPSVQNPITDANVSTYIASAAIGSAYIKDLNADKLTAGTISADRIAVGSLDAKIANIDTAKITSGTFGTLRIGANAVTIPVSAHAQYDAVCYAYSDQPLDYVVIGTFTQGSSRNGFRWDLQYQPPGSGWITLQFDTPKEGTLGAMSKRTGIVGSGTTGFRMVTDTPGYEAKAGVVALGVKR